MLANEPTNLLIAPIVLHPKQSNKMAKASIEVLVNEQPSAEVDVVLLCEGHCCACDSVDKWGGFFYLPLLFA